MSLSLQSQIITLTTTSKSPVWSPNKVTKTGQALTWKATASGMADQFEITNGLPIFDLSLPRSSPVTITATSTDGTNSFTELGINSLNLTSLIVANADFLKSLSCTDNQLTSLDITNNVKLTELFCHSNQISELNITKNTELNNLACFFNSISVLDLSQNTLLSKLSCSNNLLTKLDLSNNTNLISLECNANFLEGLNIQNGNNTIIESFKTTENINLFCIQVDDVDYSTTTWKDIDSWTSFNEDCTFTNEAPTANDDNYDTFENSSLVIDAIGVLSNDTDPDGDSLSAILETDVINGNLVLNSDGSLIYTPNKDFFGTDYFTYKANDGELDSNIATVIIEVIIVNTPPIANENFYEAIENTTLNINKNEGVLSNDADADDDLLIAVLETNVSHGNLDFNSNGSFVYTPDFNFNGLDIFTYKAFDGLVYSNEAQVNIFVQTGYDIIMPNGFTPNNDNFNDYFKPTYKGMEKVEMAIYDTWGNLIFYEEGGDLKGWDGRIKGGNAENGNYLYTIIAFPLNDKKVELKGLFTLIK